MGAALERTTMDRESYLRWEAGQETKHEYLNGEIFAMVGVRREHAVVTLTLGSRLRQHLQGSSYQTFVADMKLHIAAVDAYFYPDVMVTCDARDRQADYLIEHPCLVIEILSDTTAAFDRGDKFAAYRKLDSLQEFLLVDIATRRLELYRRAEGHWLLLESSDSASRLWLESVGLELSPAEVFEDLAQADQQNPIGARARTPPGSR